MVLLRSLHIASRQLYYLLVLAIVLGLLALIAAVWLSDEVAKRKDDIAQWASAQTGYPIEIGAAGMYWFDLVPKLEVQQVRVLQKDSRVAVAAAENMHIRLDLLATLLQREPVVTEASISGARLSLEHDSDGVFRLVGLDRDADTPATPLPQLLRWLSWFKQLELSRIEVDYTDAGQDSLSGSYLLLTSEVAFDGRAWTGDATIRLPSTLGERVEISGKAGLSPEFGLMDWRWRIHGDNLQLARLAAGHDLAGILLEQGTGSMVLSASHDGQAGYEASLELDMVRAGLSSRRSDEAFTRVEVDRMQARLHGQFHDGTWQLEGRDISLEIGGESWPQSAFRISRDQQGNLEAEASYLRLSDISAVAMLLARPPEALAATMPAGDVYDLSVRHGPDSGLEQLAFSAREVVMLPWDNYPGATNLSFDLDWKDDRLAIVLNSQQTSIYPQSWLDRSVYLEAINGRMDWSRQGDDWQLEVGRLQLWNEALSLQLEGTLRQQAGQHEADLRLGMQEVVISELMAHVPLQLLDEELAEWLDGAFSEGRIGEGYLHLSGDPAAFPFEDAPDSGRFEMVLQVENTRLNYADDWPDLQGVDAEIRSDGNTMQIVSQSGRIAGFAFADVTTTIRNLVKPGSELTVDGRLRGSTADALAFLRNSPLDERFGTIAEWISAEGRSEIRLALSVPLSDVDATRVRGSVSFENSSMRLARLPEMPVTAINGTLRFDNDGTAASDIAATVLGEPVSIDVDTTETRTVINARGRAPLATLAGTWPDSVPAFASGAFDYHAVIGLREIALGEYSVDLDIGSDLHGMALEMPAPLGKSAVDKRALKITVREDSAQTAHYQIDYDGLVNADLRFTDAGPAGQILIGGERARAPATGLVIGGTLGSIDVREWLDWQSRQAGGDSLLARQLTGVQLQLGELDYDGITLTGLSVDAVQRATGWRLALSSPQLQGDIRLPADSQIEAIEIDLEYLRIELPQRQPAEKVIAVEDSLWPSMRIRIADLQLDGIRFGRLDLSGKRELARWTLDNATLQALGMQATASGAWQLGDNVNRSQFDIRIRSEDLMALQAHLGYQQLIEANQAELTGSLGWPGNPLAFSAQTLAGNLEIEVGRGQLVEVQPGAAGRMFGLLSIAAIPRRLALDFSDLFGKGFDFSAIRGRFALDGGIARTERLIMQGDSAVIEVNGPINLVDRTYDQIVKVTPKVSSALPLAGAVAGGPVGLGVGTAIYLFDRLAGTIMDREIVNLLSYSYTLKGPWEAPELKLITPAQN